MSSKALKHFGEDVTHQFLLILLGKVSHDVS